MCNMDCFRCTKPDCDVDGYTDAERQQQDAYDMKVKREHVQENRSKVKNCNIKFYDYNHSEKGAATRKRYEQSEKGKAARKRKQQKQIASGKNAEYCRRYYQRKKAEREAMCGN